ncbi:glycosyltransferase family 39 protein [Mucilaginibacter sp.]|uniref:ArnT family glycosyltransferase n=1 Tax=Mucilaginibacter sp. TaxID=1882438 RepID=UPI00262CB6E0|nr:glycosyltransferase family 39 protein [Mucilaginibacter sp.]
MTKSFFADKAWWLFGFVLIVNFAQSLFSPLLNDEPYYWLYAQYPSWGYFDHPPMIAFLIKIGSSICNNEIGVRLLSSIIGSLTFYLIYKIIEGEAEKPVNFKLVSLLLLSSIFLNLYSFLAIPDTPMLFFAVLFLYTYRRYLNADSFLNAAILAIVTSLLLYSKYHGILLVGFTILSNRQLVFKRSFYLVFLITVLLYIPHVYWEAQNGYPTIIFQFFERANAVDIQHVLSYLGEQAAVTGPVILFVFSILSKPKNQFQKALKYNVTGVFLFFLLSSFKEMVNVHWTAIAFPAMLCLAYLYIENIKINKNFIYGALIFNLIVVILFRLNLIFDFRPISNFNDKNPKLMATMLKAKSKGYPLVFSNMYNEPSYYRFYTHDECFAVNDIWFKKTQYNYLPQLEEKFEGKTVCYVSDGPIDKSSEEVSVPHGNKYFLTTIPGFSSFNNIKIDVLSTTDFKASAESKILINMFNRLPLAEEKLLKSQGAYLILTFVNNKTQAPFYYRYDKYLDITNPYGVIFTFEAPPVAGEYRYVFSIVIPNHIYVGFNSKISNCKVAL